MTTTKKIVRLEGQRRNNHIRMRDRLRETVQKMHQQEQKLLTQLGVQNYQEIKDPTAQGIFEEGRKGYQLAGEWDELLTSHLDDGIEVIVDLSEYEATTEELNRLFNEFNKNLQALSGE